MNKEEIKDKFIPYLENELSKEEREAVEQLLTNDADAKKEFEELQSFLSDLDEVPMETPSANLRMNFEEMLANEIEKEEPKVIALQPNSNWKKFLRIAASVVIVLSAFLIGKYQANISDPVIAENENKQEILNLLENTSASKRILAVNNAEAFSTQDTKILEALINRLFFDKNVNVRLAAAEALSKFSTEILVRDALIKSLETEKNASVQIEVIQILAKIQEKRAVQPMKRLLENEETPQFVKQQVQLNLPTLI